MPYPVIPLAPTWNNAENEIADVAKTKYGDTGIERRGAKGINPTSTSWDINVVIVNFEEVDAFLRLRRGLPFRLSLDGGGSDDGRLYICREWSIVREGATLAAFSGKIEQVRRLQ